MDFSVNFLEAIVRANWDFEGWQQQTGRGYRIQQPEFAKNEFGFAQAVKEAIGAVQLVHGTHFVDIGTVGAFSRCCLRTLPDEETNRVISHLLEIGEGDIRIVGSPMTEKAVQKRICLKKSRVSRLTALLIENTLFQEM